MFRALIVLGALALFTATASAQPGNLPLSPGVVPSPSFGPGLPMAVRPTVTTSVTMTGPPNLLFLPVVAPLGFSANPYSPFLAFGYPSIGYVSPPVLAPYPPLLPATVEAPQQQRSATATATPVLAREFPATLTVQFPAAAEVWLDGKKLDGEATEERVLTSPAIKPGEQYTFSVKARWTTGGKTYEATRSLKAGPGDRSRLFVISGEEVRK